MSNIAKQEATEIAAQDKPQSVMGIIQTAMSSPDFKVEQLPMLLQFQKDLMAEQAKIAYNEAMARLQPKIKQVAKTKAGHNNKFASHDEIDDMVRPLYTQEGFSIDFTTDEAQAGKTTFYGTLSHQQGHSRSFKLTLPPDTGGSKNAIQAVISTNSYAKRELTKMMFNIIVCDEDKDGDTGEHGTLDTEKAADIDSRLRKLPDYEVYLPKFLSYMRVDKVTDIAAADWLKADNVLSAKEQVNKKVSK